MVVRIAAENEFETTQMNFESFSTSSGQVEFSWPKSISEAESWELFNWLDIIKAKIRRSRRQENQIQASTAFDAVTHDGGPDKADGAGSDGFVT